MDSSYTSKELMICCAARLLEDGRTVAVGTGAPCAAAMLAQRTTAPQLVIFFEAGGVAPQLPTMPISVGDSRTFYRSVMATSMSDVMETCQRGLMDYTFLGGAQIDPYGNLNSTLIGGDYAKPRVRLPGSGGANDLASLCRRILVVMNQDARRFVPRLDFLTTPGYLTGPGAREAAGLPPGSGGAAGWGTIRNSNPSLPSIATSARLRLTPAPGGLAHAGEFPLPAVSEVVVRRVRSKGQHDPMSGMSM